MSKCSDYAAITTDQCPGSIALAVFNLRYLSKDRKGPGQLINNRRRYCMDTNQIADEAMLVNFRAPRSVIETLDQLSKFHHRTRTSILLDLITGWINERTCDTPLKVRQLADLKSALNSHEQSAYGNRGSARTSPIKKTPRNSSELIPVSFYSSSMADFDGDRNGHF
jgi:hypothetical protein